MRYYIWYWSSYPEIFFFFFFFLEIIFKLYLFKFSWISCPEIFFSFFFFFFGNYIYLIYAFAINDIYANNNNGYTKSKSRVRLALVSNLFSTIMKNRKYLKILQKYTTDSYSRRLKIKLGTRGIQENWHLTQVNDAYSRLDTKILIDRVIYRTIIVIFAQTCSSPIADIGQNQSG